VTAAAAAAAALASPSATAGARPDHVVPFSKLRRHICERTTLSAQTIPHYYLYAEVDMSAALALCQSAIAGAGTGIGNTDLIIQSTARALRRFPELNAYVETEGLIVKGGIHIGVATVVPDGLLLPVVPEPAGKSLEEIAAIRRRNAAAARRGVISLTPRPTFSIHSLETREISRVVPLINPPECAVLGTGAVQERVVAREGEAVILTMMSVTLGCDHRAVDGVYAAGFLEYLKIVLENPRVGTDKASDTPGTGEAP
jgi:pyruvate dehydrogenase E2 component (dihydrolipoamide acetyltransferase)